MPKRPQTIAGGRVHSNPHGIVRTTSPTCVPDCAPLTEAATGRFEVCVFDAGAFEGKTPNSTPRFDPPVFAYWFDTVVPALRSSNPATPSAASAGGAATSTTRAASAAAGTLHAG